MKSSNMADIFRQLVMEQMDEHGQIKIKELIDAIYKEYDPFYALTRDELIKKVLYPQVVTLLNHKDFYSLGQGTFINLDYADIKTLETLINRFNDQIEKKKAKVNKLEKKKAEIKGQMTIVFDGLQFAGYEEMIL